MILRCWMVFIFLFISHSVSAQHVANPYLSELSAAGVGPRQVRAQLVPMESAVISTEIAGRIADLSLKEGERFEKGQRLIGLDCDIGQARLEKAAAQADEAQKTLGINRRLDQLGSVSELELDISAARLRAARAEMALMQAMVDRCEIIAPFSGRVAKLNVRRHQFVAEGDPLIEILNDRNLEIEMVVPSSWLQKIQTDATFEVMLDETGQRYDAVVTRIGARIDPVSQSVKVFGALHQHYDGLLSGMSGAAVFP